MNLVLLSRKNIDIKKWDRCVSESINENPMGYSWYMDILSSRWKGLVLGDYEAVMPIEVKTLGFISKSSHSFFILFQGFYTNIPNFKIDVDIIISKLFKYKWYSFLHCENPSMAAINSKLYINRASYILDLSQSAIAIKQKYDSNVKRNLRSALAANLKIVESQDASLFTTLKRELEVHKKITPLPHLNLKRMEAIIKFALNHDKGVFYVAYANDVPVAVAFFLIGKKKCLKYTATNTLGRKLNASFAVLDHFISSFAGSSLHLDFAGSSIKGIADFNKGFGAERVDYRCHKINNFPNICKKLFLKKGELL